MESIDKLMTTGQVAKAKDVTSEAVRQAVRSGALHPTRREKPMLFHPSDVKRWTPHVAIMRRAAKARQGEAQE